MRCGTDFSCRLRAWTRLQVLILSAAFALGKPSTTANACSTGASSTMALTCLPSSAAHGYLVAVNDVAIAGHNHRTVASRALGSLDLGRRILSLRGLERCRVPGRGFRVIPLAFRCLTRPPWLASGRRGISLRCPAIPISRDGAIGHRLGFLFDRCLTGSRLRLGLCFTFDSCTLPVGDAAETTKRIQQIAACFLANVCPSPSVQVLASNGIQPGAVAVTAWRSTVVIRVQRSLASSCRWRWASPGVALMRDLFRLGCRSGTTLWRKHVPACVAPACAGCELPCWV